MCLQMKKHINMYTSTGVNMFFRLQVCAKDREFCKIFFFCDVTVSCASGFIPRVHQVHL